MRTIKLFICLLSLFALTSARAEIASGSYTQSFSGDINLWDISGTYTENLSDIQVAYTLNMEADGKITGAGTFVFNDGFDYLSGDFTVTGAAKGSAGVTRVTMTLLLNGSGVVQGYDVLFTGKLTQKLEIDVPSHEMQGTSSGSVKVYIPVLNRSGSRSVPRSYDSVDLPVEVDGMWNLLLNLVPTGTTYTGAALVELSNGRSFNFDVTGAYSAKKDTSKLKLAGPLKALNLNLLVSSASQQLNIQTLKGSALGQKVAK